MSEAKAKKIPANQWPGQNLLGKALEQLKCDFFIASNSFISPSIEVLNIYQLDNKIPEGGVYIGRPNKKLNLEGSIFANPFPMKDQSIEERERGDR